MKVVSGSATHVRRSVAASGNRYGVNTDQIVTLRLGAQSVQIWMPSPPLIEEGDEVVVAGDDLGGALNARAYQNRSNGTYGRWAQDENLLAQWLYLVLYTASMGFVASIFVIGFLRETGYMAWALPVIAFVLIAFAARFYSTHIAPELKTRRALDAVRRHKT